MALVPCKECGAKISDAAKLCPQCGAKPPKRVGWLAALGVIAVGAMFLNNSLSETESSNPSQLGSTSTSLGNKTTAPIPQPIAPTGWIRDAQADDMTSKNSQSVSITSSNTLNFDFPYRDANNRAYLTIRQHPRYGLHVIFQINKGQIICGYDDCKVLVRFDEGAASTFSAAESEDHDSKTLFIESPKRFIAAAKTAKKIRVQFTAYQQGAPVMEFDTPEPLVWPPTKN